ncbi:hypothetical protein B0H19DRAFT_1366850 [Mycena capillaripes]|nr:hypothetical protein B0H19DRAFT_1366850 [Mycena capillaripes]
MSRVPPQPPYPSFELPRTLERPTLYSEAISRLTLDALAPDLAELPLPFIQHQLSLHTKQMLAGLRDLQLPRMIPPLPRPTVTIPLPEDFSNVEPIYPTHVFAVSLPTALPGAPPTLVPIHGIVFAANCTAPILHGHSAPAGDTNSPPGSLVLPVCPIVLPSVQALIALLTYMYGQRIQLLFAALFPLPASLTHKAVKAALDCPDTRVKLATHLVCAHPGIAHLLGYAARVREVWRTACLLGMYHTELWDSLDLAWELVIVALNIAAAA